MALPSVAPIAVTGRPISSGDEEMTETPGIPETPGTLETTETTATVTATVTVKPP